MEVVLEVKNLLNFYLEKERGEVLPRQSYMMPSDSDQAKLSGGKYG